MKWNLKPSRVWATNTGTADAMLTSRRSAPRTTLPPAPVSILRSCSPVSQPTADHALMQQQRHPSVTTPASQPATAVGGRAHDRLLSSQMQRDSFLSEHTPRRTTPTRLTLYPSSLPRLITASGHGRQVTERLCALPLESFFSVISCMQSKQLSLDSLTKRATITHLILCYSQIPQLITRLCHKHQQEVPASACRRQRCPRAQRRLIQDILIRMRNRASVVVVLIGA